MGQRDLSQTRFPDLEGSPRLSGARRRGSPSRATEPRARTSFRHCPGQWFRESLSEGPPGASEGSTPARGCGTGEPAPLGLSEILPLAGHWRGERAARLRSELPFRASENDPANNPASAKLEDCAGPERGTPSRAAAGGGDLAGRRAVRHLHRGSRRGVNPPPLLPKWKETATKVELRRRGLGGGLCCSYSGGFIGLSKCSLTETLCADLQGRIQWGNERSSPFLPFRTRLPRFPPRDIQLGTCSPDPRPCVCSSRDHGPRPLSFPRAPRVAGGGVQRGAEQPG